MYQSYSGIGLLVLASLVCFALAWTRSDRTPLFVGHALLAGACVLTFFSGSPTGLLVLAAVVLVVDLGLLVRNVVRD